MMANWTIIHNDPFGVYTSTCLYVFHTMTRTTWPTFYKRNFEFTFWMNIFFQFHCKYVENCWFIKCLGIRILHDCPSQRNATLMISNCKLTSDSNKFKWCDMLQSITTTIVRIWLTHARLGRKLHGSVYLNFKWLKFFIKYKRLFV